MRFEFTPAALNDVAKASFRDGTYFALALFPIHDEKGNSVGSIQWLPDRNCYAVTIHEQKPKLAEADLPTLAGTQKELLDSLSSKVRQAIRVTPPTLSRKVTIGLSYDDRKQMDAGSDVTVNTSLGYLILRNSVDRMVHHHIEPEAVVGTREPVVRAVPMADDYVYHPPRWIRTSEKLPEQTGISPKDTVILCDSAGRVFVSTAHNAADFAYWQPMPKAPRGEPATAIKVSGVQTTP